MANIIKIKTPLTDDEVHKARMQLKYFLLTPPPQNATTEKCQSTIMEVQNVMRKLHF